MDTQQYLSMFLEESMDNLQTLNESLLELEQQPNDIDKLNEIFRVAHTIKGMAATMGYNDMAELTHKMEDVLSKFREGQLKVTQRVVTVLFECLDTLEKMVDDVAEGIEGEKDIADIMKQLESIAEGESIEEEEEKEVEAQEMKVEDNSVKDRLQLNEYDINVIKQAGEKGFNSQEINIVLDENTLLKSARAFLIFKSLEENGEIIKSIPSAEDIENENFDFELSLVYITTKEDKEVFDIVSNISEVSKVEVSEIDLSSNKIKQIAENNVKVVTESEIREKEIEETSKNSEPKHEVKSSEEVKKPKAKEEHKERENNGIHKKAHQSVRVDLERLDKFMNMVSELVIHRTRLEQISTSYKLGELNETLEQVARTTSDLQDLVMKIRMLPLDVVFNRFPRMIRDLSVELNKEMEFVIEGQDTELDRTVIDEIGEPLIHLIRNAADHGIESKEDRIAKGKKPVGRIKLSAYQEGTKAVIKVEDDGKGIEVEKVRIKAERMGISTDGMSDNDIRNLIFLQGFSTNEQVTDISGRGVGMDVVKTKIAALGGTVDVISEIDKGSTFIIKLPLTLQIIQALLVKVGSETMAISLGYIDRVIDYSEELLKKTNGKEVIIYRGNVIPLVRVNENIGLEVGEDEKRFIVIVNVGEKTVGLLVDGLLGQQEIVIKPLGKTLQGLKEYIGATILGDGLVTLILDVAALI
ncbi:chemotaxis protein CheA [Clostridium sp. MSJ-4]|uniref:Chemotaxis protein CheA n=1 Tax=Clostridium simiarum TaxID=2841506 RepID=A0ABS6EY13_9CLOT|nr:chemotaxis protein CheA [Clostridium simiarum]MBU5591118.1 chemotaxis protein CheA [Clostridium simiarum]